MSIEAKIIMPDEFVTMCDFMDVSPKAFLENFVRNILSYEDVDEPDGAEMAVAIRYYLIYSANRNRIYSRHVQVRDAFINKSILQVKPFLIDNDDIVLKDELQEFIEDWKNKWRKLEQVWQSDEVEVYSEVEEDQGIFIVNRSVLPFERIELNTVSNIILQKGDKENIRIEANARIAHIIQADVETTACTFILIMKKRKSFLMQPLTSRIANGVVLLFSTLSVSHARNR
jgi:hypothetical protein